MGDFAQLIAHMAGPALAMPLCHGDSVTGSRIEHY